MSEEFVVNDKRLFSKDGRLNENIGDTAESQAKETADSSATGGVSAQPSSASGQSPRPSAADLADEMENCGCGGGAETLRAGGGLPPANFAGLLVGLATSAFIHLGEGSEGQNGAPDLEAAKHSIDLLAILQDKTEGNLENEEEELLTALLYDLRMKYVQACKK